MQNKKSELVGETWDWASKDLTLPLTSRAAKVLTSIEPIYFIYQTQILIKIRLLPTRQNFCKGQKKIHIQI